MTVNLILVATVIISCIVCKKISNAIGTPMLFAFILLGMLFGSDGLVNIPFDNYILAEQICSVALIFIMFYGGFGTKWSAAKPVAFQAIALSSLGTMMTAGLVGLFCYFVLKIPVFESFLIGAIISSTDAASVFSILRSKRLNLRYNTASLLEVESGSNDPFAYMLTVLILSCMNNGAVSFGGVVQLILSQIVWGVLFGFGISGAARLFFKKAITLSAGTGSMLLVATALTSYALPMLFGGNGYLSAYIAGIVLGNGRFSNKQELVHFFDGTTGLMQMLLFFLLGLLSFPSQLPRVAIYALITALFLTFVARPIVVFITLSFFKSNLRQKLLVAWSGMRGAASIVFAIMAVNSPAYNNHDIFHMIFFMVLFSILLQGALLPVIAAKLKMTDPEEDVMKTFNDYSEEDPIQFIQFEIPQFHSWADKRISEIVLPPDCLLVLLIREEQKILPTGDTVIRKGDVIILGGISIEQGQEDCIEGGYLVEREIEQKDEWKGKVISDIPLENSLIVLIKRENKVVIPKGNTMLAENDVLVIASTENLY